MTPAQRATAIRLADVLELPTAQAEDWLDEAAALLRELAAPPVKDSLTTEPQSAPVAWWCKWPHANGGGGFITCDERAAQNYMRNMAAMDGPVLVPLFDHPPRTAPLTFAQLCELMPPDFGWNEPCTPALVRHILEAAHGIGSKE